MLVYFSFESQSQSKMKLKLLKIGNFLAVAFALALVCKSMNCHQIAESPRLNRISSDFPKKNAIQPLNDVKNLHEFLEENFNGTVLGFNLTEMTKPGDSYNSRVRGLQVKLVKNDLSNEVIQ